MDLDTLLRKLRYKESQTAQIVNLPEELQDLGKRIPSSSDGRPEFTLLFIRNQEEFNQTFLKTMEKSVEDGMFWLAYPKTSSNMKSDVTRDTLWGEMKPLGYRPVFMIRSSLAG